MLSAPDTAAKHPVRTLIAAFAAWKAFLLAVAVGSLVVGDAYDTSAGLALGIDGGDGGIRLLVSRLSSWDAIYFVAAARRGYEFEQAWAFGSGLPTVVSWLVAGLRALPGGYAAEAADSHSLFLEALVGVLVANASHLLSALVLYRLGVLIWSDRKLAFVAALLHILSPGGLFLSAPNAEAPFSLLSFVGYLLFALRYAHAQKPALRDACTVFSGVLFGLSSTFRSNGILGGIPFAWEALQSVVALPRDFAGSARQIAALVLGGSSVALGTILPQAVAYQQFCLSSSASSAAGEADVRPWCKSFPPSIFTFVQQHYWNVGFLRYWTFSNLPLFLLAGPMLFVLFRSGMQYLQSSSARSTTGATPQQRPAAGVFAPLVGCLAATQIVLALLAVTTYHVQIITRISSGYPLWYWWVASKLISISRPKPESKSKSKSKLGEPESDPDESGLGNAVVVFAVMYAAIQGVLFASFLPPA